MKITVRRYMSDNDATLSEILLDGETFCYGLEDEHRDEKVMHETRIPAGRYDIKVRKAGSFHSRYSQANSWANGFHRGMLWLQDVPGFTYIYIHPGNTDDHTSGCILVGYTRNEHRMMIGNSRAAYRDLYEAVIDAAENDDLQIEMIDDDR